MHRTFLGDSATNHQNDKNNLCTRFHLIRVK